MKATSINDLLITIESKIDILQQFFTSKGDAEIDLHSDHTYYGLVEAIIDDLQEAKDLITISANKVMTVVSPDEY